jgi:hypothetical protein
MSVVVLIITPWDKQPCRSACVQTPCVTAGSQETRDCQCNDTGTCEYRLNVLSPTIITCLIFGSTGVLIAMIQFWYMQSCSVQRAYRYRKMRNALRDAGLHDLGL